MKETKLRPSNLAEAKAGAPVMTRSGQLMLIITFTAPAVGHLGDVYPIAAISRDVYGAASLDVEYFTEEGIYISPDKNTFDLFMAPQPEQSGFANVYLGSESVICKEPIKAHAPVLNSFSAAQKHFNALPKCAGIKYIEWEQ